jgi:hypothetical protein
VYSSSLDDHVKHLDQVLQLLRAEQWRVKLVKCSFAAREISYLGYRISAAGVSTCPDKVNVVVKWPTVTPGFKIKNRCSLYVCPGSSYHIYNQNVNTENQCLYYINFITRILSLQRRLSTLSSNSSGKLQPHRQSTGGNTSL